MRGVGIQNVKRPPTFTSVSLSDILAACSLAADARFQHLGRPPFFPSQSAEGFTHDLRFQVKE
jgi:hypothetical protein